MRSDSDTWQIVEIEAGIAELDIGEGVSHEAVSQWLKMWGKLCEANAPE